MALLNNNNIREDAVFKWRVKHTLLCHGGAGGLVNVLDDFNARHAAAVDVQSQTVCTDAGLTYAQFTRFLEDHDVELTPFEAAYLCRSFDDHGTGHISANTFTRHLTGLNERRLRAVKKAWSSLQERGGAGGEVSRKVLLSTYAAVEAERACAAASDAGSPTDCAAQSAMLTEPALSLKGVLASTFGGAKETHGRLKEAYLASLRSRRVGWTERVKTTAEGVKGESGETAAYISYAEFLAFYAGVSPEFATDEAFVTHVLQSWAADDVTRPTLDETAREWGPGGDPLAFDGPRYVKDALNLELGISSKSFNYSHMQREHPYVEPLPPLNRPVIMKTTVQRTYVHFDKAGQSLADPLVTRRSQLA
ncbi:hypothetical protein JKF63_06164 [Porcisia hertigi]|uniref:EF-hand domain-containing protein n=1 Tax=Porcisia hertigi TaxID=2761500 RepID=A0A836IYJ1_9TRYP|nr:hypothetical protein JKF63_06164 [Porcisia hertigi]